MTTPHPARALLGIALLGLLTAPAASALPTSPAADRLPRGPDLGRPAIGDLVGPVGPTPQARGDKGPSCEVLGRCEDWRTHHQAGEVVDVGHDVEIDPSGRVVVTGLVTRRENDTLDSDGMTYAHDLETGRTVWSQRYDGPASYRDKTLAVALSDGAAYTAGLSTTNATPAGGPWYEVDREILVERFDVATGAVDWRVTINASHDALGRDVAVGPDGETVYVAGEHHAGLVLYAVEAATGQVRWNATLDAYGNGSAFGPSLRLDPAQGQAVLAGSIWGPQDSWDYGVASYDLQDGSTVWRARYDGAAQGRDTVAGLDVTPDGSQVVVAGTTESDGTSYDYGTVAFDGATGEQDWSDTFNGPADDQDAIFRGGDPVRVGPAGRTVYVTGGSTGTGMDVATLAYEVATGDRRTVDRYNSPTTAWEIGHMLDLSSDGSTLLVSGWSYGAGWDYLTVAYDTDDLGKQWAARYDGPSHGADLPRASALAPDASRVVLTGTSFERQTVPAAGCALGCDSTVATTAYTTGLDVPVDPPATHAPSGESPARPSEAAGEPVPAIGPALGTLTLAGLAVIWRSKR